MAGKNVEGPRGFAVMLGRVEGGDYERVLAEAWQDVGLAVREHAEEHGAASGSITITLKMSAKRGKNGVTAEVGGTMPTVKLPKSPRDVSIYFLTKGGNCSEELPKQMDFGLREVDAGGESAADRAAKSV